MSKRRESFFVPDAPVEGWAPSRTDLRAERQLEQKRLDELTQRLVDLPGDRLNKLELGEALVREIRLLASMKKGPALARQRRYIATLLREVDGPELTRKIDGTLKPRAPVRAPSQAETWRKRLVHDGDKALDELLTEHPTADRQRLRQATRAAAAEWKSEKLGAGWKKLLALLREHETPENE